MKLLIIVFTTVLSSHSFAKTYEIIVNGGGEIRHGGYFGTPVLTSFEAELQIKLARLGIQVNDSQMDYYTNAVVDYDYKFDQSTFYNLFPKARMKGEVRFYKNGVSYTKIDFSFPCGYLVQDGGNATLKMSCVSKMAKVVKKLLQNFSSE